MNIFRECSGREETDLFFLLKKKKKEYLMNRYTFQFELRILRTNTSRY